MAELTFEVDTLAVETIKNATIKANFAELSVALKKLAANYETVLYTDEEIPEAKKELARLRNLQKHINDYKIMVVKQASVPIEQFKDECKKVIGVLDEAVSNLNRQITESEEKRKQDKLASLKEYYKSSCTAMADPEYTTFEMALHPKWENKGTSLEECQKYMTEVLQKNDAEVKTIRNLHSEWETSLLNEYQRSHDLLAVLSLNEQLTEKARQEAERKRKAQEEYERKQAELKRQQEEAKKAVAEAAKETGREEVPEVLDDLNNPLYGADLEADLQKAISADQWIPMEEEKTQVYQSVIWCIRGMSDEIEQLRQHLTIMGIDYEEVG